VEYEVGVREAREVREEGRNHTRTQRAAAWAGVGSFARESGKWEGWKVQTLAEVGTTGSYEEEDDRTKYILAVLLPYTTYLYFRLLCPCNFVAAKRSKCRARLDN